MGAPSNTFDVYDGSGQANDTVGLANREDLSDIIYDISPTETPAVMYFGRGSATNPKHEHLTDSLAVAASNYQFEGDDYGSDERNAPQRLYSYSQISAYSPTVSGTQESTLTAGGANKLAYQIAMYGKELKRDMERHITGFASTTDATNLAGDVAAGSSFPNDPGATGVGAGVGDYRSCASLATWIFTNVNESGSNGATVSAGQPADNGGGGVRVKAGSGNIRALTEAQLKEVLREAWTEGGNPSLILCDGFNKQVISSFTGGTTRFDDADDKRLVTAIDVYVHDFGSATVVPDRFLTQPVTDGTAGTAVYALDPNYWSVDYLRPFQQSPLAKTGDNEKRLMLTEWTLCSKNEKASGAVYDVTFS